MGASITSLTLITLAVVGYGVVNRRGYGRALALAGATPVGAAAVVGGIAVPTFYAVALGSVLAVFVRSLLPPSPYPGGKDAPIPASRALSFFALWGVLVTLVSPLLFSGLPVLRPGEPGATLMAGVVVKTNIAQITYLVIGIAVVAWLARSRWTGVEIVGTATCLATLLSFWSWSHITAGVPFPEGLFDNSPFFAVIETLPDGSPRVRGIFSEPAGLASSCLVTAAYCCSRLRNVRGLRRGGVILTGGVAIFLGAMSTSTTFIVAGSGLLLCALAAALLGLFSGKSLSRGGIGIVAGLALSATFLLPYVANSVGEQVRDKIGSSSYVDRSSSDAQSLQLLYETFGLGAGVGSNRASSFAATLLSTVGLVGTVLFVVVVAVLVRGAWADREARPAAWALIALLVAKVVSGPDLSDTSGVLWLSLGVLAHVSLQRNRVPAEGPDTDEPSVVTGGVVK